MNSCAFHSTQRPQLPGNTTVSAFVFELSVAEKAHLPSHYIELCTGLISLHILFHMGNPHVGSLYVDTS